jgi:hypothetical protein
MHGSMGGGRKPAPVGTSRAAPGASRLPDQPPIKVTVSCSRSPCALPARSETLVCGDEMLVRLPMQERPIAMVLMPKSAWKQKLALRSLSGVLSTVGWKARASSAAGDRSRTSVHTGGVLVVVLGVDLACGEIHAADDAGCRLGSMTAAR